MACMRNIKIWLMLFAATSMAAPPGQFPLSVDILDMAAISRMSPQQLEALAEGLAAEEILRTKRSSAQALTSIASKGSGLTNKFSLLAQASSYVGSLSKSGHGDEHPGYSYEPESSKVDFWGLKKSILYTLFQAVKAITGGVTILKGQLIKGGGALAATLGKVISVKGDAVSNLGKKIVSSAALSQKKPHSTAVYGPPPATHIEYGPPSGYGAPTAPAHYSYTGPSGAGPTGFAAHKYPSHLDGRAKLNGVHAGLVILTPLEAAPSEVHPTGVGHTPLEPPPSILNTVYSAIKNAFSSAAPSFADEPADSYQPPPPQPVPPFKPMTWGAVNSYGEPVTGDSYDYDPRNVAPSLDYASSKKSTVPAKHGLTPEKLQKITSNLNKLASYMNQNLQRSSEDLPKFNPDVLKGQLPLLPTPVVSDNEIGVLPADLLPGPITTTPTSTTTTTTTEIPKTTTDEGKNRRKDVKYILLGNRIVQV